MRAERRRKAHLSFLENLDDQPRHPGRTTSSSSRATRSAAVDAFGCDRAWFLYPCDPDAGHLERPDGVHAPGYPGGLALGIELPGGQRGGEHALSGGARRGRPRLLRRRARSTRCRPSPRHRSRSRRSFAWRFTRTSGLNRLRVRDPSGARTSGTSPRASGGCSRRSGAGSPTPSQASRSFRSLRGRGQARRGRAHRGSRILGARFRRGAFDALRRSLQADGSTRGAPREGDFDAVENRWEQAVHPEDRAAVMLAGKVAIEHGRASTSSSGSFARTDRCAPCTAAATSRGTRRARRCGCSASCRTLTQRRRAEDELRASEARFRYAGRSRNGRVLLARRERRGPGREPASLRRARLHP